jgi:hypothetical protein
MTRSRVARLLVAIAIPYGFAPSATAFPTIRFWPDGDPPCNTTLQSCIDGAGPDDQIRIATDGPILEGISFSKPLSVVAQSGYHPVISSMDGIQAYTSGSGDQTIRIDGLSFDQAGIGIEQRSTGTATIEVTNNSFANGATIGVGTLQPGMGPMSFVVSGNTITSSPFTGRNSIFVGSQISSGLASGSIADNTIETRTDSTYAIRVGDKVSVDVVRNRISGGSNGIGLYATIAGTSARILGNLVTGLAGQPVETGQAGPGALPTDGIDVFQLGSGEASATIVDNTIANLDTGILLQKFLTASVGIQCEITNDLITGNQTGIDNSLIAQDSASVVVIRSNLFFGNTYNVGNPPGTPISIADPRYVSDSDFHLRPDSPAIDAGDDDAVPADLLTDLDGAARIQGSHVDIGAFEAPEPSRAVCAMASLSVLAALGLRRRPPRRHQRISSWRAPRGASI